MNLQMFAGLEDDKDLFNLFDVDDPVDDFGEPIPDDNKPDGVDDPVGEPTSDDKQKPEPDGVDDPVGEPIPDDNKQEDKPQQDQPKPEKRVQTPEENARFAEMRRQKQAEERAKELLKQTPEYQLAQFLAQQYGMTPEQLLAKVQEAVLQRQAQQMGVPIEVLKQIEEERRARQELEQRLAQTEFQNWYSQKQAEMAQLKSKFSGVLTDEDLQSALMYQLETLKNPNLSLEQVVYAVHGEKIAEHLRKIAKQEALAEISGRKQGPLPPQSTKSAPADYGLTEEEKYVARKLGLTEAEYAKFKAASSE